MVAWPPLVLTILGIPITVSSLIRLFPSAYLLLFAYENEQSIFSSSSPINAIPDRVVGPTRTVTIVTQQLSKGAPLGTDGVGCARAGSASPSKISLPQDVRGSQGGISTG